MRRSMLRGLLFILLPYLSVWIGLLIATFFFAKPEAERQLAADPRAFICGNQFMPVMFTGIAVGYCAGLWASWKISKRFLPDSEEVVNK